MRLINCKKCNKEFEATGSTSRYCSGVCLRESHRKHATCKRCGTKFLRPKKGQRQCDGCLNAPCLVEGCDKSPRGGSNGYCSPHYQRFLTHGNPLGGASYVQKVRKAIDHPDDTRTCSQCETRKPLAEFAKDANATRGRKAKCKECVLKHMYTYYRDNQDSKRAKARLHRKKNLEMLRERDRERYERDKDKRISLVEQQLHKRRARRNQAPFEEGITRAALRKRDGDNCTYCGVELNFVRAKNREFTSQDATIEHRLPLSRGGSHVWDNVALACRDCNLSKNSKTEEEFFLYLSEIEQYK